MEAVSAEEADRLAIEAVSYELKKKGMLNTPDNPPIFEVSEIQEFDL